MPSIIARLTERQERDALLASIGEAGALHQIQRDRAAIEATVQTTVANWRALLTESVIDGRQLLREVLMEPPQFDGKGDQCSVPKRIAALPPDALPDDWSRSSRCVNLTLVD